MTTNRTAVIFRCDASISIGTGHVMRCLTLAGALRDQGADIAFACREHEGHLCALIGEQGFRVLRLSRPREAWAPAEGQPDHAAWLGADWQDDADETLSVLGDSRPDWLIVDHYGIDARWECRLRAQAGKIMAIDDLADRAHDCDLLLDQNLVARQDQRYEGKTPEGCAHLLGPAYAPLQPDYARLRDSTLPRSGPPRRLLISFGGVDRDNLTSKTVNALLTLDRPDIEAEIVLSAASPQFQDLRSRIAEHPNLRLHDRVPSLAPLILAADLGIGAGGATSWERLCLGLPSLVVTVAENQRPIAEELSRRGLVRWLGESDAVGEAEILSALEELAGAGLDEAWSSKCLDVVDGRGVERVCAVLTAHARMPLAIRPATQQDEALLLEWANDPATRRNAFNPKPISPEEHRAWFRARLQNRDQCILYIAETAPGIPFGQIRFDRRESEWEISYSLAPAFRGRGLGRPMLEAAIVELRRTWPGALLVGQVKPENLASRKIFESLDFSIRSSTPDRHIYERHC